MDLFILPRKMRMDESKAGRAVKSSMSLVNMHWRAKDVRQINNTVKTSIFYMVIYDNEWFDPRLIEELKIALVYSSNIEMFVVFLAKILVDNPRDLNITKLGGDDVIYQPRVFNSLLKLNPDEKQPLPYNHDNLNFEKLIGGWLYSD